MACLIEESDWLTASHKSLVSQTKRSSADNAPEPAERRGCRGRAGSVARRLCFKQDGGMFCGEELHLTDAERWGRKSGGVSF